MPNKLPWVFLGAALIIGGCSTLQPHLEGDPKLRTPLTQVASDTSKFEGDLPTAILYADDLRRKYYGAVGEHSLVRNGLGFLLVPVSAAAVYLGITGDAGKNTIAALGVGGAAAYSLGLNLANKDSQLAYLKGSQLLGCAILSARPLLMKTDDYQTLVQDKSGLGAAIDVLEVAIAKAPANAPFLTLAKQTLSDAKALRKEAVKLASRTEVAGLSFVIIVDNIRDDVSRAIVDKEITLETIKTRIAQIGAISGEITKVPAPQGTKPQAGGEMKQAFALGDGRGATPSLEDAINSVAEASRDVWRIVNRAAALAEEAAATPGCGGVLGPALKLDPDLDVYQIAEGGELIVAVNGGTGIPRGEFVGDKPKNITAEMNIKAGIVVVVLSAKSAKEGEQATYLISDGAGSSQKKLTIRVKKK